jgi:hypothetical protein
MNQEQLDSALKHSHQPRAIIALAHHYQSLDEESISLLNYTRLAVELHDPRSIRFLALAYLHGTHGCEQDPSMALDLLLRAENDPHCLVHAAQMLFEGFHVPQDTPKALDLLVQSARRFGFPRLKPIADTLLSGFIFYY